MNKKVQHQLIISTNKQHNTMPAEILNRLELILPEIEASVTNQSMGTSMETGPLEKLKAEMRAMKFIWNLPIISTDYLREDEKICGICRCKYDDEFKVCSYGESACCLPCGHVAGHQCLRAHLSPYESGFTKCPFCNVDFPQMFTDPEEPAEPTSEISWTDLDEYEQSDEELSRQVSQLSNDSGVSRDEIKRYLSIGDLLERSRTDDEEPDVGTEARDFATKDTDVAVIGEGAFPKNRKMAGSPTLARAAKKTIDLIAKNF